MEPLILYFVLFFPSVFASPLEISAAEAIPFSIFRELGRTLTYTIPSLALLWYLISAKTPVNIISGNKKGFWAVEGVKPGKRDLLPFAIGLPGLMVIGLGISLLVSLLSEHLGFSLPPKVEGPVSVAGYSAMVFSCLGTGYLEESYFRYYLLTKLENPVPNAIMRVFISTILFSLCHIYEGPWGILNAVLAGILLSVLFVRYRSLHGIAWAHGVYNVFVYAMGNLIQ